MSHETRIRFATITIDTIEVNHYIVTMTIWTPNIQRDTQIPLSHAIVEALEQDVQAGKLAIGDRLPTHRELAERLGIAIGTVSRAYALAQRQGLISGEIGRGTFVGSSGVGTSKSVLPEQTEEASLIDLSRNRVVRDLRDPSLSEALSALGTRPDLTQLFDFYQPAAGAMRHRTAGAAWMSRDGFSVPPERTLVVSGAQHAMSVTLAALTKPGDTILTEHVTYPGIRALASLYHLQLHGLSMDQHGLQPEAFSEACRASGRKVLYCVPTLHNPTGTVMPEARRRAIAGIAQAHHVAIIEDDVYGFLYPPSPPPIAAYAPEHCYYINSTSKSIAPGLRIGYIVAPAKEVHRLAEAIRTTTWEASPLMAELATIWIENGTAERILSWKRKEIGARHALALRILAGSFNGHSLPASCHIWIPLPAPWRNEDFVMQAHARGVRILPAEAFVIGRGLAPHAARVCLGSLRERSQLEKGLHTLAEILQASPEPVLSVV